ncbi:hypothetical protein MKY29_12190 [Psychrobacillus sp. FSL K6-2365]|uniref:hypothetical protein n=1 Tax=Psychrobacillus sp. FSL K6-2365 TaxID=2921546 RepID=UPI0030FBBACB
MKNKFRNLNEKAKFHLDQLIQEIHHVAYNEGYEAGKLVGAIDSAEEINDKWLAERKVKSANQQRAELIEMAKKFVKDAKDKIWGGILVTMPNNEVKICNAEFIKKGNRTTCLLKGQHTNTVFAVGRANCVKGDVYNESIGEVISLFKALKKDIPVEFLEAVQPSEVVEGMIVEGIYRTTSYEVERFYNEPKLNGEYGRAFFAKGFVQNQWVGEKQVKVIDDTNAQYEVSTCKN